MDGDNVKQTLAVKLKELREEIGLSQTQLADKLGVSRGSISFYENQDRMAGIDFIYKAASFFECTTDYLLGLSEFRNKEEANYFEDMGKLIFKKFEEIPSRDKKEYADIINNITSGYINLKSNPQLYNSYMEAMKCFSLSMHELSQYPDAINQVNEKKVSHEVIFMLQDALRDWQAITVPFINDFFSDTENTLQASLPEDVKMNPPTQIRDILNDFREKYGFTEDDFVDMGFKDGD